MALGFSQSDLDNLKAALVSGSLRVRIGDREVMYRSQKEIIEAIRIVQEELSPPAVMSNVVPASFSKGSNES